MFTLINLRTSENYISLLLDKFLKKKKTIIKIYPQKEALKALGENQFLSKSTPYKEG